MIEERDLDIDFAEDKVEPEIEEIQEGQQEPEDQDQSQEDGEFKDQQEESVEEEVKREPAPEPKKRDKAKTRINQIQREKYQALDEVERLKAENDQLRQAAEMSSKSATLNYERNVAQSLQRAKELKMQAIESGDVEAQVNADIELARATSELTQFNNWKAQQEIERNYYEQAQQQQQYYQQSQLPPITPEATDWSRDNDWFHVESPNYDHELAVATEKHASMLDNYYLSHGRRDLVYSPEYFHHINTFVNEFNNKRNQHRASPGKQSLNMRPTRYGGEPVKNSYGASSASQKVSLSPEEREIARYMNISDKEYLRFKLQK